MRLLLTALVYAAFTCSAFSQHISIEYSGSPLTHRDKRQIEIFLRHAADFYSRHGLSDTLNIRLNLFDDKEKWKRFLIERNPRYKKVPIMPQGIFNLKTKECSVMLVGGMKGMSLGVIRHELSHALFRSIFGTNTLPWLNEGLSEYFQHCNVTKNGLKHSLEPYEKGRLRTMLMLDEIRLEDIFNYKHEEFMHHQQTNDQVTYITSHAIVTFFIEATPQDYFKKLVSVLKDSNDKDSNLQKIDKTYPGGWEQLKKDFEDYYK